MALILCFRVSEDEMIITQRDTVTVYAQRPSHNGTGQIVRARANAELAWKRYYQVIDDMQAKGELDHVQLEAFVNLAEKLEHEYSALCHAYHNQPAPVGDMAEQEYDGQIDRPL